MLNLGCGPHWADAPDGWTHADRGELGQDYVVDLAEPPYPWEDGTQGLMVMHHVLHMLDPDQARLALRALRYSAAPGGVLRIGERDFRAGLGARQLGGSWLLDAVADTVEPTLDGKFLRWLTWHGTVRSLWSPTSLCEALTAAGWSRARGALHGASWAPHGAELDTRPWETFYVEAVA